MLLSEAGTLYALGHLNKLQLVAQPAPPAAQSFNQTLKPDRTAHVRVRAGGQGAIQLELTLPSGRFGCTGSGRH